MPDLTFDFTWYKDAKGYRLIPPKSPKRRPGQSILDAILHARTSDIQPARIMRNGGALQAYRPLEVPRLFIRFIDKAKSENGVLEFVEMFGPLTYDGLLTHDGLHRNGDVVPAVIDQAEHMSQVLRGQTIAKPLNGLNASIVTDNGGMRLKVRPKCLLDALWLQLAQAKSVTNSRECLHCHSSFIAGGGADRRADAKFCSVECRIEFNSRKRSR